MLAAQRLQLTHQRAFSSPVSRISSRVGAKRLGTKCACTSRPVSNTGRAKSCLALKLRDSTANILLSLSLAVAIAVQQPNAALGDTSTSMPPPSTASTSSSASQAASRTVIDVVSGENSVLNEENTPDNRQGSDQQQKDDKKNNAVGDTSEVSSAQGLQLAECSMPLHRKCQAAHNFKASYWNQKNFPAECSCSNATSTLLTLPSRHAAALQVT